MIVNLTPHPIHIYPPDTPDRIEPGSVEPIHVIEPSGTVARIGEIELGTVYERNCDLPVEYVEYRHATGLPPIAPAPLDQPTTWYVVSLALALAVDRHDLLVPHRAVRNMDGSVIGCRLLARPV